MSKEHSSKGLHGDLGHANLEYSLGSTGPAGGFVFYLTADNLHGLEAAPVDQNGVIEWGGSSESVREATRTSIGSGAHSTKHIVAQCGNSTAAYEADSYQLNGYYDWYLPTKHELSLMCSNLHLDGVGGFNLGIGYWSSSEYRADFNMAWVQGFSHDGFQDILHKNSTCRVRAVRAF